MNRLKLLLCFLVGTLAAKSETIIVCGQIDSYTTGIVSLKPLQDFLTFNDASADAVPSANGTFRIEIEKQGPLLAELHFSGQYLQIYLHANDSIFCRFDAGNFLKTLKFTGTSGNENTLLSQMQNELEYISEINLIPNKVRELSAKEFMVAALQKKQVVEVFIKENIQNKRFSDIFLRYIQNELVYGMALDLLSYPEMHDYFNPQSSQQLPDNYYDFLKTVSIENPEALMSYTYTNFLNQYLIYRYQQASQPNALSSKYSCLNMYDLAATLFTLPRLRDHLQAALLIKATNNLELIVVKPKIDQFKQSCSVPEYFRLVEQNFMRLRQITPGNPAPAFALKDLNGRTISLSDFKGKVVYLDFWASWCRPCLQENKHLEVLRKKIPNKDVVFLNISLDDNHETWLRMTNVKNRPGIDLISHGTNSPIALNYNISHLPTYILIDKNGKLADVKAKRPSDKELINDIKNLLEK